jgi:hypothetical protein
VNGKDIVILSSGKTRVSGSTLNAEKELRVLTGDLEIKAVNDSEYFASLETNKDTFSKTVSSKQSFRSKSVGSELNGVTVILVTEHGDIELTGSEIRADSHVISSSAQATMAALKKAINKSRAGSVVVRFILKKKIWRAMLHRRRSAAKLMLASPN